MSIIRSKVALSPKVDPSLRIAALGGVRKGYVLRLIAGTARVVAARPEALASLRKPTP